MAITTVIATTVIDTTTGADYLLTLDDESIRTVIDDVVGAPAVGVRRIELKGDVTALIGPPGPVNLVGTVVGSRREPTHRAIVVELEEFFRTARERDVAVGITKDGAVSGVVAVHVHPACGHQFPPSVVCVAHLESPPAAPAFSAYQSDRLGPSSVARMRATC